MAGGGTAAFAARYSIPKLTFWTILGAPLTGGAAWMVLEGIAIGSITAVIVGAIGLLLFGGAMAACLRCMINREVQLRIDHDGLFLRPHSDKVIPLRSIRATRRDDLGLIKLLLYRPGNYPIQRRLRRFIYRINGRHAREFFGDAWIWTAHYDCSPDQLFMAIEANIVPTRFEQDLAARAAAASEQAG